jgi:TRAP transporter TAXI family solute receptor
MRRSGACQLLLAGCVILAAIWGSACQRVVATPRRTSLRIIVAPGFSPIATALAHALKAARPGVNVELIERVHAEQDVREVQAGAADVVFAFADMAYLAFVGQLDHASTRFDRLRGIAVLQRDAVHLLVGRDSGIQNVTGLRGHRVSVQLPGSGSALTTRIVLKTLDVGVTPIRHLASLSDQISNLVEGTFDAMFIVGRYPSVFVNDAVKGGARLLSISGSAVDRLREEHPFFHRLAIPEGIYAGVPELSTIGIDRVLICRNDLDEDSVYQVTKAFFEVLPAVSSGDVHLQRMNVEQAPATPIPLHEGALRYYREQEWAR